MGDIVQTLRQNSGIAIGAAAGYYLSGGVINWANKTLGGVIGQVGGKWLGVASAVAVAGVAVLAGNQFGKKQMGVAFAGVSLGQGIRAALGAVQG